MKTMTARDRIILVSGLMVTQTIGWGTTFSQIGILAQPISKDLGIAHSIVFAGATVMYLSASVSAPLAGRLADRVGGLRMLAPGSLALAAGLLLLSFSTGVFSYLAAWVVFGLMLHIGLVTAAYTGLTQAMGAAAAKGIGTLTLATGLCSSIFWPLSDLGLNYVDWRNLLQIYAAVTLGLCFPLHLWLAARYGQSRKSAEDKQNDVEDVLPHINAGYERSGFTLQVLIASCGSVITVGFGLAVIDIFEGLGASRSQAVYAGSLIGIAYVISRGLTTLWAEKINPTRLSQGVYLMLPLSMLPLLICAMMDLPLPGWLAVSVALAFGLPAGLVGVLRSTFPLYLFGSLGYGSLLGRQARVTELASALSPTGLTWLVGLSASGAVGALTAIGGIAFAGTLKLTQMTQKKIQEKT